MCFSGNRLTTLRGSLGVGQTCFATGAADCYRHDPMLQPTLIFLLLFVATPLLELYLMIEVGSRIGALSTVLLVVLTAVIGALLVRTQGFAVVLRMRAMLDRGEIPADALLEAVLLLIAGGLLLLPGFVTDVVGLLLLIPAVRQRLALYWLESRRWLVQVSSHEATRSGEASQRVIDGEYEREKN